MTLKLKNSERYISENSDMKTYKLVRLKVKKMTKKKWKDQMLPEMGEGSRSKGK